MRLSGVAVREEVGHALNSGVVAQILEGWSSQFVAWRKSDDHVVRPGKSMRQQALYVVNVCH